MPKKPHTLITPAMSEAVLLLRYHKKKPERHDPAFMPYADIAHHLDLPYHRVRYICCRVHLQKKRKPRVRASSRIIEDEQAAYLKAPATLRAWAGRSLAERSILYHRRFAHKTITAMELCRFYKRNKIKRKAVTRYKTATPEKRAEYEARQRESY